jgi:hypothetical protein
MLAAGEENMLSTALRCCQGSAYAQGCTHICLSARLSAVAHSIDLPAGLDAVLDPACAAARRERAAAHSGDIVRPSCASQSVREAVERCHSLHLSASELRCGTCLPTLLHGQELLRCVCCCKHAGEYLEPRLRHPTSGHELVPWKMEPRWSITIACRHKVIDR